MQLAAGQRWTYRAPPGFEDTRLVIGAIVTFDSGRTVICCSVFNAPPDSPQSGIQAVNIPFLPLAEGAMRATIVAQDGTGEPCDSFSEKLQAWGSDPRGFTTFTVPFEGSLDKLIAQQMAAIMAQSAA
jgi:hypothetical protein